MYYTNSMKITMKNEIIATDALKIIKTRLIAGFECDEHCTRNPSMMMHDALEIVGNTIVLPEEFGCYIPEEAETVISELVQDLAARLSTETFTFNVCNTSDYDESWINGSYANGELKIKSTYLPSGFGDYYCPECDEIIATMLDDAEGNLLVEYTDGVCPECGEEVDLSEWMPVITEKTIKVD